MAAASHRSQDGFLAAQLRLNAAISLQGVFWCCSPKDPNSINTAALVSVRFIAPICCVQRMLMSCRQAVLADTVGWKMLDVCGSVLRLLSLGRVFLLGCECPSLLVTGLVTVKV